MATNKATIKTHNVNPKGINVGDNTHHQLQVMTPPSLSPTNNTVNNVRSPGPPVLTVVFDILFLLLVIGFPSNN